MKKFLLILLGLLCLIVLLVHVGPMIGLAISLAILYFAFRKFIRASRTGYKILWAIIGLIALTISLGNIPSLIGILALVGLIFVWHSWHKDDNPQATGGDPFDHFEKEWKELH
ncbi:MAG: flagellar basal body rod protein [Sporolactobacillus sp.]